MHIIETNLTFGILRTRSRTVRTILHHADSSGDVSAAVIHQWHLNQGWAGIGYHFLIHPDGSIERGRPEYAIGSHSGSNGNGDSIGVCFAGRFMTMPPTRKAVQSYLELHAYLENKYGHLAVYGHREVMATSCPGDAFPLDSIKAQAGSNTAAMTPIVTIRVGGSILTGILIDQSSYAPVRKMCEALGRQLEWDGSTNTVIVLPLQGMAPAATREPKIVVDGKVIPAILIGDSSYAPVRALAEAMGRTVKWDETANTVTVQ